MATSFSQEFLRCLRAFMERSRHKQRLKDEINDNIRRIESGGADDEMSKMYAPDGKVHVCPGATWAIIYSTTPAGICVHFLERVGL